MTAVQARTVAETIAAHARNDDGSEFLRLKLPGEADCVRSYAGLVDEAGRWAAHYEAKGLKAGDRIIVILPHSLALYASYIGALLRGLVPAMFAFPSPKFSEELYFATVGQLIVGSRARLLVSDAELRGKLSAREPEAVAGMALVTPDEIGRGGAVLGAVGKDAETAAFLQYSSGTTGIKKGVAVSDRALLWQTSAYAECIKATAADRIVTWLPLYHDMGLIAAFFLPLLHRIPLVAISPFDWVKRPALWVHAASEHRATLSWMPNFAFNFMARSIPARDLAGVDLSSLRGLVNCSEPVVASSHEAFLARFSHYGFREEALAASYAMAENTFAVTSAGFGHPPVLDCIDGDAFERAGEAVMVPPGTPRGRVMVSSGRPLRETRVRVLGPDGSPLPDRRVGELAVTSPSLMTEYDGNPEATAAALIGGELLTGDQGYLVGKEVFVTGRKKDLIIVGGRNIYPQDVETAVGLVSGVIAGRCAAFGVFDESAGTERLVVVAESDVPPERHAALKAEIHAAVAERTEIVPSDIRIAPPRWLVKSSSGKMARGANRDRYLAEAEAPAPAATAITREGTGDLSARVRAVVRRQLDRARPGASSGVGDDTPLITSGLIDSFGLAELIVALESETGLMLTPDKLCDPASIDSIAAIVRTLGVSSVQPGADIAAPGEAVPLTYPQPPRARPLRGFWSLVYRVLFFVRGVKCGSGLHVLGPLLLQIDGKTANIRIGNNVTLMPGVHLKNRENGMIVLHDGAKLDTMTRLVAANDATITVGANVALGMGTVVNAGADVTIGRGALSSTYCMINASDHAMAAGTPIREQRYEHTPISIGEDVFLGAHCYIGRGSWIGNGAVISAGAAVNGPVPPGAVVQGRPARVLKYRS